MIESRVRAGRAVQPGRHLRRVHRGRPRGRRAAAEPTAEDDLLETAGIAPEETVTFGEDPYAAAADSWAAGQPLSLDADDDESAARRLYDLALEYQERSQRNEARLLEDFEAASAGLIAVIGDLIIVDDDDERLIADGRPGRSGPRSSPRTPRARGGPLDGAEELVEFYDPTDVFGDLADALAEAFPSVAPELERPGDGDAADGRRRRRGGRRGEADAEPTTSGAEDEPTA